MTNDELTRKDSMLKVLLNFFQKIAVSKGGAFVGTPRRAERTDASNFYFSV